MKSNFNLLCFVFLLLAVPVFAQEDRPETVFITTGSEPEKEVNFIPFQQLSFSINYTSSPIREIEDNDNYYDDNEPDCIICNIIRFPDGIGIHYGYGVFYKSLIGISANAGIDLIWSQELVSTPIYGTLTLAPFPEYGGEILLQASLGYAFALGYGNLSGTFQKYRIGGGDDNGLQIFFEVNFYNFPVDSIEEEMNIGIGVQVIDLF